MRSALLTATVVCAAVVVVFEDEHVEAGLAANRCIVRQANPEPSLSADGRYVAFGSLASNLVSDDTNEAYDVFVHDRQTRTIERASVTTDGTQADFDSGEPVLNADGRYVVFRSLASNLVSGDRNARWDIFLHDRARRTTRRISLAPGGRDAEGGSYHAVIASHTRYVAFRSSAHNLVPNDTNQTKDIFVHNVSANNTRRISVGLNGGQANDGSFIPAISADARFVAFSSDASNLVRRDTNRRRDIFVRDRAAGTTQRVSVSSDGSQSKGASDGPTISGNGRYVAFSSGAPDLVGRDTNRAKDVFVHDRRTHRTKRVSFAFDGAPANRGSYKPYPALNFDGRFVAFTSESSNLVPRDTNGARDVFVRDLLLHRLRRVSVAESGIQGNGDSFHPSLSSDGRFVAFASAASNLVAGDTNGALDIFVRDRLTDQTARVSVASDGSQGNGPACPPESS